MAYRVKILTLTAVLVVFVVFLFTSCRDTATNVKIAETVTKLKAKYAPDRRLAVFDMDWRLEGNNVVVRGQVDNREAKDEILAQAKQISGLDVIDSIEVLPNPKLGNRIYGIIRVSVANLRREPGHSSELTSQALMGSVVKILKSNRGWSYCQMPDKYLGWMERGSYIAAGDSLATSWNNAQKVIVIQPYGTIRSEPNLDAEPVSDVVVGVTLKDLGRQGNWVKVELPDKRQGYVQSELIEDFVTWKGSRQANPENIVSTAKQFKGLPYLWGGTSAKGFDCSGFTKTVYWLNGVELLRDANQQVRAGEEIEPGRTFENLRKGDLLFFGRKAQNDSTERIVHVGIYIGNREFIHSSTMVEINSLDPNSPVFNKYRYDTFIRAKRLLKN
jgi:uncharacterized protein YgiM (DUF1202 family)